MNHIKDVWRQEQRTKRTWISTYSQSKVILVFFIGGKLGTTLLATTISSSMVAFSTRGCMVPHIHLGQAPTQEHAN